MLRALFIGNYSSFDELLVHWLSQHTQLTGVVWTDVTRWQRSWTGRVQYFKRRARLKGLPRAIDETLFFLTHHQFMIQKEHRKLDALEAQYWAQQTTPRFAGPQHHTLKLHQPEVYAFIRACAPDLIIATCVTEKFKPELRALAPLGTFLWHEGITPGYRGLYGPFWALKNLDFASVGYTFLRMSDGYDDGEIYAQGPVEEVDLFTDINYYPGHKAIADSLPAVAQFLTALELGEARPLPPRDMPPGYYSFPGLSDLLVQRLNLWRHKRQLVTQSP